MKIKGFSVSVNGNECHVASQMFLLAAPFYLISLFIMQVHIASVFDNEYKHTVSFNNPIKAVALDPLFAKSGSGNRFVTGDYKVSFFCYCHL